MTSNADGSRTDDIAEEFPDTEESNQPGLHDDDARIGLTEAFAPVSSDDYDDPLGLTQAFGPLDASTSSASAAGADGGSSADDVHEIARLAQEEEAVLVDDDTAQPRSHGRHARPAGEARPGASGRDANADDDASGGVDAAGNAEPADGLAVDEDGRADASEERAGAHSANTQHPIVGKTDAEETVAHDEPHVEDGLSARGARSADDDMDALDLLEPGVAEAFDEGALEPSRAGESARDVVRERVRVEREQRAGRMRRTLITAIILLVVLVGALAFFGHRFVTESQKLGVEQARQQSVEKTDETLGHGDGKDAGSAAVKITEVPAVASALGLKRDAAVDSLGHGATVTSTRAVDDAESAIKSNATVTLTSEPVDSKTGAPSVYLGMDGSDTVIQVGYSSATSALGYGTLSFADAVGTEHVIEKTLRAAGIDVADGAAKLPADKASYTTFAADGKTAVKERCSFSGQIVIGGQECTWSAVLSYDYVTANLTGDVADTVRSIYVYATANVEPATAESKADGAE